MTIYGDKLPGSELQKYRNRFGFAGVVFTIVCTGLICLSPGVQKFYNNLKEGKFDNSDHEMRAAQFRAGFNDPIRQFGYLHKKVEKVEPLTPKEEEPSLREQ